MFLDSTKQDGLVLLFVRLVRLVLLDIPVHRRSALALAVPELAVVAGPQKVRNAVAVGRVEREGAVQRGPELVVGQKAQRVADVDDGVARARLYALPLEVLSCLAADEVDRGQDLEAPLRRKEQRERTKISMLILADLVFGGVQGRVVVEEQGAL